MTDACSSVLLILAGPAGSGKTTLCERMVAEVPGFSRVVTTTTRAPRAGEINGVHYHFFSMPEFESRLAAGEFLESAVVFGRRYGTLASSVLPPLSEGRSLIMNVDVQGVDNFRRAARDNPVLARHMSTIFIRVPLVELRRRLESRAQDHPDEIARRLAEAERELAEAHKFDYIIESTSKEADFQALQAIWRQARDRMQQRSA